MPKTPLVSDGGVLGKTGSRKGDQAADEPLEPPDEPELDPPDEPEPDEPDDELEEEDEEAVVAGVADLESEDDFAALEPDVPAEAGALLDDEPRLSFR